MVSMAKPRIVYFLLLELSLVVNKTSLILCRI